MEAKWNRSYGHGHGRDDLKEGHKSDDDERLSHRRHHAAKKGMDEDEALDEADEEVLDAKVELEWKHAADQVPAESVVSSDPRAQAIIDGFNINWMNMRDATTGRQMWESDAWGREIFHTEKTARLPKAILRCRSISREINFSSAELMSNFRLEQRVYFRGACIEEWLFQFGFVIPGSTNSWQQVIEAAEPEKMLPADVLSGNLVIETGFYDGSLFLGKTVVRILSFPYAQIADAASEETRRGVPRPNVVELGPNAIHQCRAHPLGAEYTLQRHFSQDFGRRRIVFSALWL